jgi:hypothetical protein
MDAFARTPKRPIRIERRKRQDTRAAASRPPVPPLFFSSSPACFLGGCRLCMITDRVNSPPPNPPSPRPLINQSVDRSKYIDRANLLYGFERVVHVRASQTPRPMLHTTTCLFFSSSSPKTRVENWGPQRLPCAHSRSFPTARPTGMWDARLDTRPIHSNNLTRTPVPKSAGLCMFGTKGGGVSEPDRDRDPILQLSPDCRQREHPPPHPQATTGVSRHARLRARVSSSLPPFFWLVSVCLITRAPIHPIPRTACCPLSVD